MFAANPLKLSGWNAVTAVSLVMVLQLDARVTAFGAGNTLADLQFRGGRVGKKRYQVQSLRSSIEHTQKYRVTPGVDGQSRSTTINGNEVYEGNSKHSSNQRCLEYC